MSLLELPNDVLISVFGHLNLKERHRSLALVSRRCWQLVCSPALLHTVELKLRNHEEEEEEMPRLRSLVHFLLSHGAGSVRQLTLDFGACGMSEFTEHECRALVLAAVTACSGLEQLDLECDPAVALGSWLQPLGGILRRLRTGRYTATVVDGSLEFLTALQDLELGLRCFGEDAVLGEAARLPTSLTRLALSVTNDGDPLPPQIGTLRQLAHLHIHHPYRDADSYTALTRLPLHTLKLTGCVYELPSCLSALTSLRSLTVDGSKTDLHVAEEAVADGLLAALPHLTGLMHLAAAVWSAAPLAALTALTALQSLCWWCRPEHGCALPPGAWLHQLRTLEAFDSIVAPSLEVLSAAQRLEHLHLHIPSNSSSQLLAIALWAAQQPSLRQLLVEHAGKLGIQVRRQLVAVNRLYPGLCTVRAQNEHPDFAF